MLVFGSLPSALTAGLRGAAKGSSDVISPLQHPPTGCGDVPRAPGSPATGSTKGWSQTGRPPCLCFVVARGRPDLCAGTSGCGFLSSLLPTPAPSTVLLASITSHGMGLFFAEVKLSSWMGKERHFRCKDQPAHLGAGWRRQQEPAQASNPQARWGRVSVPPPLRSGRRNNNRKRRELAQTKDKQTS